jgi:hypothetical protein
LAVPSASSQRECTFIFDDPVGWLESRPTETTHNLRATLGVGTFDGHNTAGQAPPQGRTSGSLEFRTHVQASENAFITSFCPGATLPLSGEHAVWLSQRIRAGDFTLRGLVAELGERGLRVDYHSVWEFVHAEKLSFKKSVVAGERDRRDVARRRAPSGQSIKTASTRAAGLH